MVYPQYEVLALYELAGNEFTRLKEKRGAVRKKGGTRVRMEVRGTKLQVYAKGVTQMAINIPQPSWTTTRVFVGGAGPGKGARVRLSKVEVRGRVRFDWLRKSFGQLEALLYGALARADELPVFSPSGAPPKDPPLSAEDEFGLKGVDPRARAALRELEPKLEATDWRQLLEALRRLNEVLQRSPEFAAAYFARARLLQRLGNPLHAQRDLEVAERLCPRFHEAQALHARLLLDLGKPDEAEQKAEEAIASAPGEALGYVARGMVRFAQDRLQDALADLELGRALAPWEEQLVGLARNVRNVIDGPPWSRRFEAKSEHYQVLSDISQKSADEYARRLEAARAYYLRTFPLSGQAGRSKVLIFDTEEGYHSYAELSTDDRVESTLGCYLPRYRQLLLFEDKDDRKLEKTTQVLFHEGFHQFMHALVPDNLIPYWLNEGLAEFMSACRLEGEAVAETGRVLEGRLEDLRTFVRLNGNKPLAFAALMQESPAEFYSGPVWAKYAQAWSMVHFFETAATAPTRERYRRYLTLLREGTPGQEAFDQCWKGADWAGIQRRWWGHVEQLK
ncbi:MAG: DUF1570 domain-containing protein [Planctomycetota bacterium]